MTRYLFRQYGLALLCGLSVLLALSASKADDSTADLVNYYKGHWAFLPLDHPRMPAVSQATSIRTGVDAFVLSALENAGLGYSPEADRHALIRRLSFDLTGLPPTPEEITNFVQDPSPQAYEKLVDRLLNSPHFGERWARHWLDGAGYADVVGTDNDAAIIRPLENRWMYRDYVVESLNADKSFDRFLIEQLAGDELVDWRAASTYTSEIREPLIATGFLRMSPDDTFEKELNLPPTQHGVLERTIEIVANDLLGLSLGCAKCHDHKYEPLSQHDYYRFKAIFQPAFNPDNWQQPIQRQVPGISAIEKTEIERHNAELDRQLADVRSRLASLRTGYEEKLKQQKLATLPEVIRADTKAAIETPADKRNEVQKYLAGKFEQSLQVKPEEVSAAFSDSDAALSLDLEGQITQLNSAKKTWPHWQVIADVGPPTPTRLLERGNPLTPSDEVQPGFLSVLCSSTADSITTSASASPSSSGRRLALARWLTDRNTPAGALVIRVRVNRIWQHLFGKGLVETTDNFGVTGSPPTNPALLEWLCHQFVANGQELKPFVRRIVLSNVYRQSSSSMDDRARSIDPDNRLLWRQRLRRLESEAVRDAILTASGKLDRSLGGPPLNVDPRPDGSFVVKEQGLPRNVSPYRRTLYLLARRNYHPALLTVFDQPNLVMNCTARQSSAIVLQSLTMLNDRFALDQSAALATAVLDETGTDDGSRFESLFLRTLGRPPKPSETIACSEAMQREMQWLQVNEPTCSREEADRRAFTNVCHTLINASEFLYIP